MSSKLPASQKCYLQTLPCGSQSILNPSEISRKKETNSFEKPASLSLNLAPFPNLASHRSSRYRLTTTLHMANGLGNPVVLSYPVHVLLSKKARKRRAGHQPPDPCHPIPATTKNSRTIGRCLLSALAHNRQKGPSYIISLRIQVRPEKGNTPRILL